MSSKVHIVEVEVAAGVGADEDVAPGVVRRAAGAGDGEDAAEGEDLEESSGPGSVAEAAAESLFLCWKFAASSLSRWVFLGDLFFGNKVFFGRGKCSLQNFFSTQNFWDLEKND